MRLKAAHRWSLGNRVTLLLVTWLWALPASVLAQASLPERLLTPEDLAAAGLKGVIRPPADMYDPAEGLHFVRQSDSALVLTVGPLNDVKRADTPFVRLLDASSPG